MANHPSADKRNRQRIARTARNQAVRTATRTAVKKAREALAGEDAADAEQKVKAASIALAKAAKKGVIHPAAAARTTSRIASALSKRS